MKITFLGANHEVTGSCTLLEAAGRRFLIDCGMEQGKNVYENQPIPVAPGEIDWVLATHAHIDHTGMLPLLVRNGFRGKIYATNPTVELCGIMLRDSAHIQEFEAEWKNRKAQRSGAEPVEPMYTVQDAEAAMKLFVGVDYEKRIELAPGIVMNFVRIPAGKFVMGSNKGHSDYSPANKQEVKKAFWMAEIEVSNEQFRTIFPDHNSRFVNQLWKDHVHQGYPANNPEQPAIRVSWEEAMAFCEKLSEKTGLKVTLPTEMQWEWACRAGSESDFWYGALNTDFAAYENMGDKQLNKLAVRGVNPQPMSPGDPWYKYYTYQPKDNNVDDGNMLMVKGGGYQANPWGLYDMQGNIAEWTRSDYLPYPYNEKAQGNGTEKVVRGGSWTDHPKTSTAYYRKSYLPWQKVHNVGFRVIIED